MPRYGKTPAEIEAAAIIWAEILCPYPIARIEAEFMGYMRDPASKDFPTPQDIIQRINRAAQEQAAAVGGMSGKTLNPAEQKRKRAEDLIARWEAEWRTDRVNARSVELGIEGCVWRFARAMADTQAWLLVGGNPPGFPGEFRGDARSDERLEWYKEKCRDALAAGRIQVTIPAWVGERCLAYKEKGF